MNANIIYQIINLCQAYLFCFKRMQNRLKIHDSFSFKMKLFENLNKN